MLSTLWVESSGLLISAGGPSASGISAIVLLFAGVGVEALDPVVLLEEVMGLLGVAAGEDEGGSGGGGGGGGLIIMMLKM